MFGTVSSISPHASESIQMMLNLDLPFQNSITQHMATGAMRATRSMLHFRSIISQVLGEKMGKNLNGFGQVQMVLRRVRRRWALARGKIRSRITSTMQIG